ncbi:hypothetical protein JN531_016200 [Flagellatimonas centrodinii]|uniref:hypothetical protein n=1 Tax=Flagellatimonas centrodinii TaxID=2806210 RepID=UPI001FEED8E6|nr:hypothetical protein [Flagellatimonas centrodinii]ULQ48310.1 hypothetical protein JN531_016200 [Flagellatimonas centrodinii]
MLDTKRIQQVNSAFLDSTSYENVNALPSELPDRPLEHMDMRRVRYVDENFQVNSLKERAANRLADMSDS